ncbi:hypothetical protein FRC05_007866 [Tulasnella sp. 425]|nr:hypothetical protein FRC05_007866 [Tulasnella sp. 425]
MEGKNYAGLPSRQERSADTPLTFPEMRSLHLTAVPALDALSILLACDLQKITHLELSAFRRNVDEPFLDGVVLPNLRTFVLGFALAGLESTREDFSKATPSLKSLQLVVAPDSLGSLASHLGGKAPRQLEELTVWIWDPSEWIRDAEHPDLKPLLGLVKKKGWESGFTLSGRTGMLSWSLVQPPRINDVQSAPDAISSG